MYEYVPPKPVDEIEVEATVLVATWYDDEHARQIAHDAIRHFRSQVSKEGYVFYLP